MQRSAGVLLHPTCLPSAYGIGDIGAGAHRYLRWLRSAGVTWWQMLPLNPPGPGFSPYSAWSTFAGNPWLISPDALVADGLLGRDDVEPPRPMATTTVDIDAAVRWKRHLLSIAWRNFRENPRPELARRLVDFRHSRAGWIEDGALFAVLKHVHGGAAWTEWPQPLRRGDDGAVAAARAEHAEAIDEWVFGQFLFFSQWASLRSAATACGIKILGDLPIFVAMDSADVWSKPELFLLDDRRRPTAVAGVPPDYFSATGQLWGNPLYDWQRHEQDGFRWWVERTRQALQLCDALRLDHFRGFVAHWEVPAGEATAINGRWVAGPGRRLFEALERDLGELSLVAEDLGEITPDVVALREELELPGMAILQFAFSPEPRSSFIPYNHQRNLVVYTGTHDNNTSVGWYREDASDREQDLLRCYAAHDGSEPAWALIRLALGSVADLAVIPHQDLAGLGSSSRMNTPGVADGNWRFRLTEEMLSPSIATRLREQIETFGRAPSEPEGCGGEISE
jgi:4-alpha-glucanotransferase